MPSQSLISISPNPFQQLIVDATIQLLEDTCFLSSAHVRHSNCRARMVELTHTSDDISDDELKIRIAANPQACLEFFCFGGAVGCGNCGAIVEPGATECQECHARLETTTLLAKPQWELRVTSAATQLAIISELIVEGLLMRTLLRTIGQWITRNLLDFGPNESLEAKVRRTREYTLDLWPDDERPPTTSWQHRFIRQVALFWLLAWPELKQWYTLQDIYSWNIKVIREIALRFSQWHDAGSDLYSLAQSVHDILEEPNAHVLSMLETLRPNSNDNGLASDKPVTVVSPIEILQRGQIVHGRLNSWFISPLLEDEEDILITSYGLSLIDNFPP